MSKAFVASLCIAATAQSAHAADARWSQAPTGFLANSSPRGTFTYEGRDREIVRIPLVWTAAATIEEAVTFEFSGESETLPVGTSLPAVTLSNARPDGKDRLLYCTPSKVKEKVVGGGLFAVLQSAVVNSLSDSQKCLEDADGDGKFERTIMVGEGPNDMRVGGTIAPAPYVIVRNQPIGPRDYVSLELSGVGKDSVSIWLSIYQDGKAKLFKNVSQAGYTAQRMTKFKRDRDFGKPQEIFGIHFMIVAADAATKSVQIEWPQDAPAGAMPLIPVNLTYTPY